MGRPPSIQWYYKQWLGDNKVLAMDWDAKAMHFHLLLMSIQEEPPGSLPDDMDAIRRWLCLPSGSVDADQTWRRVRPQIFAAWSIRETRWFNAGMVATLERAENYRSRYENGTKKARDSIKTKEVLVVDVGSNSKARPSFEEVSAYCGERKNAVDPQKFVDYYTANGWKVGRNSMKDWRAAVRTWEKNGKGNGAVNGKHEEAISRVLTELYGPDDENAARGVLKLQAK
jgi:hypothetical protein